MTPLFQHYAWTEFRSLGSRLLTNFRFQTSLAASFHQSTRQANLLKMTEAPKSTDCKKKSTMFLLPVGLCCILAGVLLLFLGKDLSNSTILRSRQLNSRVPPNPHHFVSKPGRKHYIRGRQVQGNVSHLELACCQSGSTAIQTE
jgi:hypothetical protein